MQMNKRQMIYLTETQSKNWFHRYSSLLNYQDYLLLRKLKQQMKRPNKCIVSQ